MSADKSAADVLEEAADLLLVHGRCRDALYGPAGEMCVLAAIGEALPSRWNVTMSDAWAALSRHVFKHHRRGVVGWNTREDDDGEVRDTLLLAAKELRQSEVPS